MAVYKGEWSCFSDVFYQFPDGVGEAQLVYASYEAEQYEGSALVVWAKDGQLWEDSSSHCSCNGLWDDGPSPEATSVEAFLMRPNQDRHLIAALFAWVQQSWEVKACERGAVLASPAGRAILLRQ